AELIPGDLALIVPWDANATADRIAPYLESQEMRREHIAGVRAAAAPRTWKHAAHQLMDIYAAAASAPVRESCKLFEELVASLGRADVLEEALGSSATRIEQLEEEYRDLRAAFSVTAEDLVGPNGAIPPDLWRPLLAVGNRRILRAPMFGLLRLLYGGGY